MKVLIVDDNSAIREIIAEILTVDGCEIRHAADTAAAEKEIEGFRPDVTILDSTIGGRSTLDFANGLDRDCGTKIILIVSGKDSIPRDNPLIIGAIRKPFRSSEILEAVRGQRDDMAQEEQPSSKKERSRFRFFSFGRQKEQDEPEDAEDNAIRFGHSYLVLEDSPSEVYAVAQQFTTQSCDILFLTTDRPKAVRDCIDYKEMDVIGISPRPRDEYVEITHLGTMMAKALEYAGNKVRPVVVIDDLSRIIESNNINLALTMVHQIVTSVDSRFSLVVSVRESLLTEKDKGLLMKRLELYRPAEAAPDAPAEGTNTE